MRIIGFCWLFLSTAAAAVSALTASPRAAEVGQADLTVTVSLTGSQFSSTATVMWNGSPRLTTFRSPSTVDVLLDAADVAHTTTAQLTVADSLGKLWSYSFSVYWPCGTTIGSTVNAAGRTVSSYSNGIDTTTGLSCGVLTLVGSQYQCVELIRRYYIDLVSAQYSPADHDVTLKGRTSKWHGNGVNFFDDDFASKGLTRYANGDTTASGSPPRPDDIIVFQQASKQTNQILLDKFGNPSDAVGHVAIVTTSPSAGKISILEQNWGINGTASLNYSAATNTVQPRVGQSVEYKVLGWLRSSSPVGLPAPPVVNFSMSVTGQPAVPSTNGVVGAANTLSIITSPGQVPIINFDGTGSSGAGPLTYTWTSDDNIFPPSAPCLGPTCQFGIGAAGSPHQIKLVVSDKFGQLGQAFAQVVVLSNPPPALLVSSFNEILKFDPTTGLPLGPFASGGGLNVAQMMAIGPDGNLYVASSKAPDTFVLRYDGTTGAPLPSTGNAGTAIFASGGGLTLPVGITFGPDGNLYVGDYGPSDFSFPSIRRYNGTTGAPMGVFASGGGLTNPAGIVFGPDGNLYVSNDLSGNSILRYNGSSGLPMPSMGNGGAIFVPAGSGGLVRPQGLTFGPDGRLYVSSFLNGEVLKFDQTTGAFLGPFASTNLVQPLGLVFGPDGNLYVVDIVQEDVVRFNGSTGVFMDYFVPTANNGGLNQATYLLFK